MNTDYNKITAIINTSMLEAVEEKLKQLCVPGISITRVQGYGEGHNFFRSDWICEHARIEVFIENNRTEEVAQGIMDAAHSGNEGDGIIAVLPVNSLYRIRTKQPVEIG